MASTWRRARLSFRERFVDACDVDGVVVAQYASSEAFAKATGTARARDDDDDDDDDDAVPATGFTVWDASVLLGKYVARADVWRRLTTTRARGGDARRRRSSWARGRGWRRCVVAAARGRAETRGMACAMTDLTRVVTLTRANARANKAENGGRIPANVALASDDAAVGTRGGRGAVAGGDSASRTWCWGRI